MHYRPTRKGHDGSDSGDKVFEWPSTEDLLRISGATPVEALWARRRQAWWHRVQAKPENFPERMLADAEWTALPNTKTTDTAARTIRGDTRNELQLNLQILGTTKKRNCAADNQARQKDQETLKRLIAVEEDDQEVAPAENTSDGDDSSEPDETKDTHVNIDELLREPKSITPAQEPELRN